MEVVEGTLTDPDAVAKAVAGAGVVYHLGALASVARSVETPLVSHALTAVGQTQLFYRMLLHRKCPSWLYPVTMGALQHEHESLAFGAVRPFLRVAQRIDDGRQEAITCEVLDAAGA